MNGRVGLKTVLSRLILPQIIFVSGEAFFVGGVADDLLGVGVGVELVEPDVSGIVYGPGVVGSEDGGGMWSRRPDLWVCAASPWSVRFLAPLEEPSAEAPLPPACSARG